MADKVHEEAIEDDVKFSRNLSHCLNYSRAWRVPSATIKAQECKVPVVILPEDDANGTIKQMLLGKTTSVLKTMKNRFVTF